MTRSDGPAWRGRLWLAVKLVVTAGVSAWIVALVDWTQVWAAFLRSSPWIILLVVTLRFGGIVISAVKWKRLLAIHDVFYRLASLLRWYLVGSFLNHFLPSSIGGDGYRIYKTWDNERGRGASVLAVALERITGMVALATLGYVGGLVLVINRPNSIASAVAVAGTVGLLGLGLGTALSRRLNLMDRLRSSRLGKYVEGLRALVADLRDEPRGIAVVLGLAFIFHVNKLLATWLLLYTLGASIGPLELLVVLVVVELAGVLPISLGGLGVVEGSFVVAMGQFGVADEKSLAAMLLLRVLMLPAYLAGGTFYFLGDRPVAEDPVA